MGRKRRKQRQQLSTELHDQLVAQHGSGTVRQWVKQAIDNGARNLDAYVAAIARNHVDDGKFGAAKWGSRSGVRVRISRY